MMRRDIHNACVWVIFIYIYLKSEMGVWGIYGTRGGEEEEEREEGEEKWTGQCERASTHTSQKGTTGICLACCTARHETYEGKRRTTVLGRGNACCTPCVRI